MITSVLIILKHLIYGGTERYTINLANSLANQGITVTLVSGPGPLIEDISPKVNLFIMPIKRSPRAILTAEKKILDIARIYKSQIIHTQSRTPMLNSQLARKTLNIPLITHEHGMHDLINYPVVVDEIREGSDLAITVGPYAAQKLIKNGLNKFHVTTILNGIDVKNSLPISGSEKIDARRKFSLKSSDKVILCLSRLEPPKGIDMLAKAFVKISKAVPEAKLLIVGDDLTKETDIFIKTLVKQNHLESRLIRMKGDKDIRKYHATADVFCYPALGKGMAVMEAMAAGLPVVGKRTTRIPLVVEHGISGLMTKPSPALPIDPDQISQKIIYLLRNLEVARRMGKVARKKIEKEYTLERVISQTLKTYEETLELHRLKNRQLDSNQTSLTI